MGRGFLGDNIKKKLKLKISLALLFFGQYLLTPPFYFGTPNLVWDHHFFHHSSSKTRTQHLQPSTLTTELRWRLMTDGNKFEVMLGNDSYQSKDIWQTRDGIYVEDTQIKVTCLSISCMTFVKSTDLIIKLKCAYFCICLWYVLNIGTIAFYYIANLSCIATSPKYTIFGWGRHMELLPKKVPI